MSAVFTPTRYKLSVEDFHKLGTAGVLTENSRVELIEGELIRDGSDRPRARIGRGYFGRAARGTGWKSVPAINPESVDPDAEV